MMTSQERCQMTFLYSILDTQIILVQVIPGETLSMLKMGTFRIFSRLPMCLWCHGTLPPVYLPPGYMSQVVENNWICKIHTVPQTMSCVHTVLMQVPQFILSFCPMYPQALDWCIPQIKENFPHLMSHSLHHSSWGHHQKYLCTNRRMIGYTFPK